jgi:hypothetical protein
MPRQLSSPVVPPKSRRRIALRNWHRKAELYLVQDPLQVLQEFESGIENVVDFLTDGICPQQFDELSSLMDERKCDIAQLS